MIFIKNKNIINQHQITQLTVELCREFNKHFWRQLQQVERGEAARVCHAVSWMNFLSLFSLQLSLQCK